MERYDRYKDSGIEWIGESPEHWDLAKLSYCFSLIGSGSTPKAGASEYYNNGTINWLQTGDLNNNDIYTTSKKITQIATADYSSLKVYPVDSLVIAMYGATIGKTGMLKIETATNQACCVLSNPVNVNNHYAFYWLNSVKEQVISLSYGGGQHNISQELIRNLKIQIPPLQEQTAIANYLDRKTTEIDALIAKKKRLLELYEEEKTAIINHAVTKGINPDAPMKDSGIPWLGEVPEHWEVKKLKNVVSKVGSGVTPRGGSSVYQTQGIPLLRSQNVYFDGLRLDDVAYISESIDEQMPNSRVVEGDVLLNITGASIGRCNFIPEDFGPGNVNQHVCIIRPLKYFIQTEYMFFVLRSIIGQHQIEIEQTGANREGLNFEQLKNFVIPLPEMKEQHNITFYLFNSIKSIEKKTLDANQQIALLSEYRTALISEVVTGKVRV